LGHPVTPFTGQNGGNAAALSTMVSSTRDRFSVGYVGFLTGRIATSPTKHLAMDWAARLPGLVSILQILLHLV
jgi:hypothetical protein